MIQSPIADLMLVADESALIGLYFVGCDHLPDASRRWKLNPEHPVLLQAAKQLGEYFSKRREKFSVPLRLAGTGFQQRVWREIALIPYGKTINYTDLAKRAGASHAIRAAGAATGRNPLSIIIPCHRVVGKNGNLCGFAGGVERKRYLLELENLDAVEGSSSHYSVISNQFSVIRLPSQVNRTDSSLNTDYSCPPNSLISINSRGRTESY